MTQEKTDTQKIVPIWAIEKYCKSCKKCVYACPAGVLSMKEDNHAVAGYIISIDYPDSCTGCQLCELRCPDRAIFVLKKEEFLFLKKATEEAKKRQEKILANGGKSLPREEHLDGDGVAKPAVAPAMAGNGEEK